MAPVKIRAGIIVYVRGGGFFIHIASAGLVFFNMVSINIWTRGQEDIFHSAFEKKGGSKIMKFLPSLNIFPALFFPAED